MQLADYDLERDVSLERELRDLMAGRGEREWRLALEFVFESYQVGETTVEEEPIAMLRSGRSGTCGW